MAKAGAISSEDGVTQLGTCKTAPGQVSLHDLCMPEEHSALSGMLRQAPDKGGLKKFWFLCLSESHFTLKGCKQVREGGQGQQEGESRRSSQTKNEREAAVLPDSHLC